jgi:hypothetical protein
MNAAARASAKAEAGTGIVFRAHASVRSRRRLAAADEIVPAVNVSLMRRLLG